MSEQDYNVNSVIRAFSLLEVFTLQRDEMSISEIKLETGLPFSTVHRLLSTLESIGYIRQKSESGKYRLGLKNFILGNHVKPIHELKTIAAPILKSLSEKYNETVHLSIEMDGSLLCVDKVESQHRISVTPGAGGFEALYRTSGGKCLLAFAEEKRKEEIISKMDLVGHTPYTITDKEMLRRHLEEVRRNGFAIDNQELDIGLICFGAPVFDNSGKCVAALSLSIPMVRLGNQYDSIREDVKSAARNLSVLLGG